MKTVFITRLTLHNYKSIAAGRLTLEPLTFLVGPNGSGKSNCLDSLRFVAESLSNGTLSAFGILLALFQNIDHKQAGPLLIGLEEPEMALHPAATGVLLGALREASLRIQVLVTTHSPDLLDDLDISTEAILAVDNEEGITKIAPIDEAGRSVLKDSLFTAGELLRQNPPGGGGRPYAGGL
jgi:predicted ATPase